MGEEYYIALKNEEFGWKKKDVLRFRQLWNEDKDFFEICRELKRKQIQVALLIMDQAQEGHIKRRDIGLGIRGYEF